ncbi:MAG: Ldh family oxidoreductase [Desulfitobacteriaceae bacterium]|nr:Ldh family oxidoreductase [Desulfitobacteriaceae bacterium]MDI6914065.1 Ldh family oxidoreductase [Desulfitobacteriaceae bacterium]
MEYPAEKIISEFCCNLLASVGVPADDAQVVAAVLIDTSLEGIDTHGLSRLPAYLTCLKNGRINKEPQIRVVKSGAVASIDGDNGLGQLVAVRSMQVAIDLGKEFGIGLATAKRSNHFGAASYFCKMAAGQGMIGQVFTNAPPAMPPWGGMRPYFGTNPVAFGIPQEEYPVVIDLSSSNVARGNVILALKEGRSIPLGWAIDKEGRPTTDPKEALEGAVLPVGGAKGYALALAVEVMAGILSGSAYGLDVGFIYDDKKEPANIGHSFIAIDVSRLMLDDTFTERLSDMIQGIKAVPLAEGYSEIRIPGEKRHRIMQERRKSGIPVSQTLLKELNILAAELGVSPLSTE